MKSSLFQDNKIQSHKRERWFSLATYLTPFLFFSLLLTIIFSLFLLYSQNCNYKNQVHQKITSAIISQKDDGNCDLYKGHWVPEPKGSMYTNYSCATIPESKNCFFQGRPDRDFLNWRWKPDDCDLPRFDAKTFLNLVRGKTLGFIGDSVARNHMESLLCLLSQEEVPTDVYKDAEDRFRTWHFREHSFTLKILWTKFLITGKEEVTNGTSDGSYHLQVDKVDVAWARELPTLDYAIISDAHWYFRKIYLYKNHRIIGCVYCNDLNVTSFGPEEALRLSFRAAFHHINGCKRCQEGGLVTLLRTFSPAHFENGTWNTGGKCERTSPYGEKDIDLGSYEWNFRNIQLEEIERARQHGKRKGNNNRFGMLDVTRPMLMRPDGHPGAFWGNKWMKGYNDCVHWCLPGPIDVWNDFLMALLRKKDWATS